MPINIYRQPSRCYKTKCSLTTKKNVMRIFLLHLYTQQNDTNNSGKTINCLELWQKYYLVAQGLERSYTTMTRKKTNNDNITIAIEHNGTLIQCTNLIHGWELKKFFYLHKQRQFSLHTTPLDSIYTHLVQASKCRSSRHVLCDL